MGKSFGMQFMLMRSLLHIYTDAAGLKNSLTWIESTDIWYSHTKLHKKYDSKRKLIVFLHAIAITLYLILLIIFFFINVNKSSLLKTIRDVDVI